jgi:hypothetical protein
MMVAIMFGEQYDKALNRRWMVALGSDVMKKATKKTGTVNIILSRGGGGTRDENNGF